MRETVHRSRDGRIWDVEITADDEVLIHETVPPEPYNALLDQIHARSLEVPKTMIGNTQRHWQHIADIPVPLYTLWRSTLGDPTNPDNTEAWEQALKRQLNDPDYRDLRVSGGRL